MDPDKRLDAEQFAIDCAQRGIPFEYWSDGLAAAEELLNADELSEEPDSADER